MKTTTMAKKLPAMCLAALVTLMFTAFPARAETPLHRPVEVNFDGISIESALATLGERAGVRFEYDAELVRGLHPVTYEAAGQEAGRVAMRILRSRGLTLETLEGRRLTVVKADPVDEFHPKREENYEFARKPQITRDGDQVTITFETAGWCDVTVAIEDDRRNIIRHLASGVLGPTAPEPFVWNSKAQTLVWDGKDDADVYVDDKDAVTVRVSLGLDPRFERTLFWHPWKRAGNIMVVAPTADGVFVFKSGRAVDHLRFFDHDGDFVRTLYPFPAENLDSIPGIIRHRFPDGPEVPIKPNWQQTSMLMSGSNCTSPTYRDGRYTGYRHRGTELRGTAGYGLAVGKERIALIGHRISRLAIDGTSGGLNLHGPDISFHGPETPVREDTHPKRAAFCPDDQWLYLTMFNRIHLNSAMQFGLGQVAWRHAVTRIRFDQDDATPEIFVGGAEPGDGDGQFNMPSDVATDAEGRVYVADHRNDRIQVFDPDGQHLQSIPVERPARIDVHPQTGKIYVFTWALPVPSGRRSTPSMSSNTFTLTEFSALETARELRTWDLNIRPDSRGSHLMNRPFHQQVNTAASMDFSADRLRIWITALSPAGWRGRGGARGEGVMLLEEDGDSWVVKRDFLDETARAIDRVHAAIWNRQRLYVNPKDGMLYLVEGDSAHGKAFKRTLRIDPNTGRTREIELPLSAEDMAFDRDGHAYLRSANMVMRYQPDTWREVPFDYGEERERYSFGGSGGERAGPVISGAIFHGGGSFHHGGFHVAANGNLVLGARYTPNPRSRDREAQMHEEGAYLPTLYPGRRMGTIHVIQILDRHGRTVFKDAVPGLHGLINGTAIDHQNNVYVLSAAVRFYHGERHFNDHAGTLMKFAPGEGRLLTTDGAPVPMQTPPDRPQDLAFPRMWVENAHWMYPGVGWGGQNYSSGCSCPNTRFALDYFARSFTPEIDRYNVGVVDSSGNLILRVGQYGNVEDGTPLVADGGPTKTRSIGGDETALKFAPYVTTHTDHRLFIADPGNARIASVKLGYHTNETVALKDVPDEGAERGR